MGEGDVDDFRRQITWNGDRDCYEGFEVFWSIRRLNSETPPNRMAFDAWKAHWGSEHENLSRSGRVGWRKLPEADRPLHRVVPDDFLLNEKLTSNPALGTASDGLNLGFQVDRLPSLPAEPAGGSESKSGKEKGEKKEKSAPHGTGTAR